MLWSCFFKQKTAYEMRISDWSSDVCSSDLRRRRLPRHRLQHRPELAPDPALVAERGLLPEPGVAALTVHPRPAGHRNALHLAAAQSLGVPDPALRAQRRAAAGQIGRAHV